MHDVVIKGMVCERCVASIKNGITELGIPFEKVSLGKISFSQPLASSDRDKINELLSRQGFETVYHRHQRLVSRVKELVQASFQNSDHKSKTKFSVLLAEALHLNYDSVSMIFSENEGITLEKFIIHTRLEKVKELLVYTNHTLTDIAQQTGFSSINHLSQQFKELTGLTPTHFKSVKQNKAAIAHLSSHQTP